MLSYVGMSRTQKALVRGTSVSNLHTTVGGLGCPYAILTPRSMSVGSTVCRQCVP
jgi:hypothetical protein